ncbi:MAG: LiaF transmembrane domain-containing protein [Chloroflexota bacterium]
MQSTERRRSVVGPILLITIGVIFLLNNLGLLGWGVWGALLRLWPLLIVAVGLDLLIGRRSTLGSVLVAVIVLGIAGSALWVYEVESVSMGEAIVGQEIVQPLDGATRADVEIGFGVGMLRLGALPESTNLVEGTVPAMAGERVRQEFYLAGETAHLRLRSQEEVSLPFSNRWGADRAWDLGVNGTVPTRLRVNTGVGVTEADLSQLTLTDLDWRSGVGKADLVLAGKGQYQARIHGGVGELNLMIPAGVAARIRADAGLGGVQVNGDYLRQNSYYVSPGYDTALNRVEIRVTGGVGRITIQEYQPDQEYQPERPIASS